MRIIKDMVGLLSRNLAQREIGVARRRLEVSGKFLASIEFLADVQSLASARFYHFDGILNLGAQRCQAPLVVKITQARGQALNSVSVTIY